MKSLGTRLLLVLVVVVAATTLTTRGYGYVNRAQPDSLFLTTTIGATIDGYIVISDGRDTIHSYTPGTVHVSFSGSSDLTMLSDSVLHFVGLTWVRIRYAPSSSTPAYGQVTIVGDSNTITVGVYGTSIAHLPVTVQQWGLDSLHRAQDYCPNGTNVGVYNQNPDTIHITNIRIDDDPRPGTQFHLSTTPYLPTWVPGHASFGMWIMCANTWTADSGDLAGRFTIFYTYHGVADSSACDLRAHIVPAITSCLAGGGSLGALSEGSSASASIGLQNTSSSTIYLDSAQMFGNNFSFASGSFPMSIAAYSTGSVSVTYGIPSPSPEDHYSGTMRIWISGNSIDALPCSVANIPLSVDLLVPVVDTITLDVPPGADTLSISAHMTRSRHAIQIHNSGTQKLLLENLSVSPEDSTVHAYFTPGGNTSTSLYDSLASGNTVFAGYLTLEAADTGTYNLDMTLSYRVMRAQSKTEIQSNGTYVYHVVAHRLPAAHAAVMPRPAPATADFTLSPNPSHGSFQVRLPEGVAAQVEVFDILGKLLRTEQANGDLQLSDGELGSSAEGSYIVRVTVRRADGTIARSSQRLVITH